MDRKDLEDISDSLCWIWVDRLAQKDKDALEGQLTHYIQSRMLPSSE